MKKRFLPSHTSDPFGTLVRVIRSGDPAARAAVWRTALGAAATPLDLALSIAERRSRCDPDAGKLPIVFICGPARSGTSLTAQVVIRQFPVAYFSNVVELFPRAPLTASRLLAGDRDRRQLRLASFYGKTAGLREPSDAMALWDRWLGADRDSVPEQIPADVRDSMRRFFCAWRTAWERPLVAKYNRLYSCAEIVADVLPDAHFVCLQRDPVFLAQSQLIARRVIVGDEDRPYGSVTPEYRRLRRPGRPVEDACAYVAADREIVARSRARVGANRFWIVAYEQFCRDPNVLLQRLSDEVLRVPYQAISGSERASIRVSSAQAVDDETFGQILEACAEFGLTRPGPGYFA